MLRILFALLMALPASFAFAQEWPARPVRIIVAFPPGGSTDIVMRALGDLVSRSLGQPMPIENRVGANGNVAADFVAKQPGDGYTVLATADALVSSPHLYPLAFDSMKDFTPVIQLTRQPIVLAVHPSTGAGSIQELVALAKAKPGLGFATSGAGSGQHIVGEWFAQLAGLKLTHVGYKGGGQAITDLVGGQVPLGSLGSTPVIPHHRAGRLKILAQSTATRAPSLPDVPTYREAGFDLVLDQWLGLFVPAGTPDAVVKRLNAEFDRALGDAGVRERFAKAALEGVGGPADQFARLCREDFDKYARLVKQLGIRLQ
jgi:tripartite-type tricarboxylate transporter receptor subunit TctC